MGCLAADTLIHTRKGLLPMEGLPRGTEYLAWQDGAFVWAKGSASFPKGKGDLYRVVHERGEFVAHGSHLVFCVGHGYRRVEELPSLGEVRLVSPRPPETTSELSRIASLEGGPHSSRTLLGSPANYSACSHQYDPRLLLAGDIAQAFAPSRGGAPESFRAICERRDARQELVRAHSHLDRLLCLLANHGFYRLSWPHEAIEAGLGDAGIGGRYENCILRSPRSLVQIESHPTIQRSSECVDSVVSSPSATSSSESAVLSIERWGHDWFWDVQVPGPNNYFAAGAIHHNSGKTSAAIQEIKTCLVENPGSVWLVGRKFLPSLRDTTLRAFLANMPQQLVRSFNKASLTLTLKNGSEVWFRPLYDPEILKSYEIAGFMIDEINEVDKEIYDRLKDRMRQKLPDGTHPRFQSIGCMNPTEEDHWIPQLFLHEKPTGHELFQSSTFQNMDNLPPEYITELERTYSKDVLQRFLYGQFGKVHKGRPVFPQFTRGNYIRPVAFDPKLPLVRGWDFGYNNPCVVFMQMDGGQVRILGEIMGKKVYLDDFIEDHVLPYQAELFKRPLRVLDYCDPKGSDQSDKGLTSIQILNGKKIYPIYRKSFINEGVMAIKRLLDTVDADKNPNFLIHPRCRILIEGLKGGYHRLDQSETPEKDGYYDHLIDATRYSIIHLNGLRRAQIYSETEPRVWISPRTGRRIEY